MARRLAETDGADDLAFEDFAVEVGFELIDDLEREAGAGVEEGNDDAEELEARVIALLDELNGMDDVREAFEGQEFGLDGDEDPIGGDKTIERELIKAGGRVDEDVVEAEVQGMKDGFESALAVLEAVEVHLGCGEVHVRREEPDIRDGLAEGDGVGRIQAYKGPVEAGSDRAGIDAEAAGCVPLGIHIDDEG